MVKLKKFNLMNMKLCYSCGSKRGGCNYGLLKFVNIYFPKRPSNQYGKVSGFR